MLSRNTRTRVSDLCFSIKNYPKKIPEKNSKKIRVKLTEECIHTLSQLITNLKETDRSFFRNQKLTWPKPSKLHGLLKAFNRCNKSC